MPSVGRLPLVIATLGRGALAGGRPGGASIQLHRVSSPKPALLALKGVTFLVRCRIRLDQFDARRLPALRTGNRCGGDRWRWLHLADHAMFFPCGTRTPQNPDLRWSKSTGAWPQRDHRGHHPRRREGAKSTHSAIAPRIRAAVAPAQAAPTHQPVRRGRPTHALLAVEFKILCDIAQRRSSAGLGRGNADRAARACR
jgi:hypothetical protein